MRFYYRLCYIIARVGLFFCHPVLRVKGREQIPHGACIFCANHANGSDPIWFLLALNAPDMTRVIAKEELHHVPFVGWVLEKFGMIFVRRGQNDVKAFKNCVNVLKDGEQLLVFLEGTRCKGDRPVRAKTGVIRMARVSGCPLVPVYITREKKLFRPITVCFGPAYDLQMKDRTDKELLQAAADELQKMIYQLGGDEYANYISQDSGLLLRR